MLSGRPQLQLGARLASALDTTRAGTLVRRIGAWRGLLVLNYHQIADRPEDLIDPRLWSATQAQLDEDVRFLKSCVEIVGPEALDAGPTRQAQVMLTFDDGYRDHFELALPVLRAHDVPGIFFVTSGFIDEPRLPWWGELYGMLARTERPSLRLGSRPGLPDGLDVSLADPADALERVRPAYEAADPRHKEAFLEELAAELQVTRPRDGRPEVWMTWDMVRAMDEAGMTIGGHTATHPRLSDLDAAGQARDITDGLDRLQAEIGRRPTVFSYPYGGRDTFDERTVAALRQDGVRFAFSYYGGCNGRRAWDPYDLRRATMAAGTSTAGRRAMVTLPRLFARW